MTARFGMTAALALLLIACSGPGPAPEPKALDDGTIVTFAPVGPKAFLADGEPGPLHERLRVMLESGEPDRATKTYANHWVQPPGWRAKVEAFGEPMEGDLYSDRGYPYRTNLVAPDSGVVVLAYTKEPPSPDVWEAQKEVQVRGRLEGYARRAPGVVILLDAEIVPAEPESVALLNPAGE